MSGITETSEQQAVMDWCRWNIGRYPELETLHHTVNEGKRSVETALSLSGWVCRQASRT